MPVSTASGAICSNVTLTSCTDSVVSASNIYYYLITVTNSQNTITANSPVTIRRIIQSTAASSVNIFPSFLYVGNANSGKSVSVCNVNQSTGALSGCGASGSGYSTPIGLARYNNFLYVANSGTNTSRCTINKVTGQLSSCGSVNSFKPYGLAVSNGLSGAYLYEVQNGIVQMCTINKQMDL